MKLTSVAVKSMKHVMQSVSLAIDEFVKGAERREGGGFGGYSSMRTLYKKFAKTVPNPAKSTYSQRDHFVDLE